MDGIDITWTGDEVGRLEKRIAELEVMVFRGEKAEAEVRAYEKRIAELCAEYLDQIASLTAENERLKHERDIGLACGRREFRQRTVEIPSLRADIARLNAELAEARALNEPHDSPSGLVHRALYDQTVARAEKAEAERDEALAKATSVDCMRQEVARCRRKLAEVTAERDAMRRL